jgi:hypothetical protein
MSTVLLKEFIRYTELEDISVKDSAAFKKLIILSLLETHLFSITSHHKCVYIMYDATGNPSVNRFPRRTLMAIQYL